MTKPLLFAALILSLLLSSGCQTLQGAKRFVFAGKNHSLASQKSVSPTTGAIPTSTRSYAEVLERARKMVSGDETLRIGQVAATGSMRPYLGESALVITEKLTRDKLKIGSLVTFTRAGAEYIHVLVAFASDGIVTKGSNPDTEEHVPFSAITGSSVATIFFDPATAPVDRSGLPVFLAASGDQIPASAGTLRILSATMLAGTQAAIVYPVGPGVYTVALQPDDDLGLTLGVPGTASTPTAEANLKWSAALAGKTVRFQIYHPDAPETGVVLIQVAFGR